MQRPIDSYFKKFAPANKKPAEPESPPPQPIKRKARVICSSDEEITESPQPTKLKDQHRKKSRNDDASPANNKSKKPSLSKLKASPNKEQKRVDPSSIFGGEMKRVEAKKPPKPKDVEVIELEDDGIDQSLIEIDLDIDKAGQEKNKIQTLEKSPNKEKRKSPEEDKHAKTSKNHETSSHKPPEEDKHAKTSKNHETSSHKSPKKDANISPTKDGRKSIRDHLDHVEKSVSKSKVEKATPPSPKKPKLEENLETEKNHTPKVKREKKESTPRTKKESNDLNSSVLSDEERHERKRAVAIMFQKYKNRPSAINPGSKEVPKGKPNCLAGLTFVVSGVLESLERDECASIIKEYGGKVSTVVGKRLNYLIAGEEAGLKKLAQAEEFNIPVLNEDGLFDLIRSKSGQTNSSNKNDKQNDEKPTSSPKVKKEKSAENETKIKKEKSAENETKIKKEKLDKSFTETKRKPDVEQNNNYMEIKKEKHTNGDITRVDIKPAVVKTEVSEDILAWVDKYKPTSVKDIIGQQGAASNVNKLINWLSKWYINHDGKKKPQKPNPWAKNDDGSFYKAALLSGPPGIGKTTTATLVCKQLGFDTVEFNASDTRSKRLLKEEVSELLSNKSLYGYFHGDTQTVSKKHILIMDEVDGMAGNEDRGGIQELIALIKESSIPIICMCNDRNHQKMRSLVNYCYDLRFNRPRVEQIKGRIMSICFKEKIKMEPAKIEEIIAATNNDIRQSINHISLLSAGKELNLKSDAPKSTEKTAQKDLKMGPWDVTRKVFSAEEHKRMTLADKSDLFFHDYSLAPLFVQQNYLIVNPIGPKSEVLQKVASTADALSLGDLVDKRIRSSAAWSLLPTQAVFSSVMPGEYMSGTVGGQINFPGWLGKYSRSNKRSRLAQEIHDHTRLRTSGSRLSIRLDYAPFLLANIVRPLKDKGLEGVEESLNVIKEYHLLREDIDALIELTTWPGKKGPMDAVDGRVKAALTRAYNKEVLAYSYSAAAGVKKKKADSADVAESELLGIDGEQADAVIVESDEDKDEDNLENDGLIKAKKKSTTSSSSKASTSKAAAATKKDTTSKTKASTSKSKK